jgi:hypothetical protein
VISYGIPVGKADLKGEPAATWVVNRTERAGPTFTSLIGKWIAQWEALDGNPTGGALPPPAAPMENYCESAGDK